jgi:hypothetical protein
MKPLLIILLSLSALTVHSQSKNPYLDWIFRAYDAANFQGVTIKTYTPVSPGPLFYVTKEGDHRYVYDWNHMLTAVWYSGQPAYHVVRPMVFDSVDRQFKKYFPGEYFIAHVYTADLPKKGAVVNTLIGYKAKTK